MVRTRKKLLILSVFLLLIIANIVVIIGNQNIEHEGKVDTFKASNLKVLFDFTKDEDAGNADWRIDGAYSNWADALRSMGMSVDSLGDGQGEITYSDLSPYNVFVLPEPQDEFTDNEKSAIIEFVHNGGGLVYIADHKSSDRNNNGWDSWSIWNDNLNFDSTFNITLVSTNSGNNQNEVTDIANVPVLTDNVSSFGTWLGTCMEPSGSAKSAANQYGYSVLSYDTYGYGRVVVHCDSSTFDDGTADSSNSRDNLHDGWSKYNDATLAINMILWAAGINSTSSNSTYLKEYTGSSPSVSYGNGEYLVAYKNGTYVAGYFVGNTGSQGPEIKFYKYGDGIRTAYNADGNNFTVTSFDYYPTSGKPHYHQILNRFIDDESSSGTYGFTISNDANKSVDVSYGSHRILFVWINLTRNQVEGMFYNTQSSSYSSNFTIYKDTLKKYDVAVSYDETSNEFLVVWTENHDLKGRFINSNGSLGDYLALSSTPNIYEAQLSVAGGNGKFMITYRNGTFSSANGAYFLIIDSQGNIEKRGVINDENANYCGRVEVNWNSENFMVIFSDNRNGNPDVFVRFYYSNGDEKEEMDITTSANKEETPSGMSNGDTMLIVWRNYVSSSKEYIEGRYYRGIEIPEFSPLIIAAAIFLLLAIRKFQ